MVAFHHGDGAARWFSTSPGQLEQLREFLNTWELPHATRVPVDRLGTMTAREWRARMSAVPAPAKKDIAEVTRLRSTLREMLDSGDLAELNDWLEKHPVVVAIGETRSLVYQPGGSTAISALLALAMDAVAKGQWARLKACPDCRHVFYDHSRNRTRTWCAMYAETPDGRACGSISKVRTYRNRQRAH